MSVEEKTEHWKKVFQYAEDRGIDIYLFHWNVFVNGAEDKHGIRWQQDHPITVDYVRKSVKQTLLTFPNIKVRISPKHSKIIQLRLKLPLNIPVHICTPPPSHHGSTRSTGKL
jgi:hypothetical protein